MNEERMKDTESIFVVTYNCCAGYGEDEYIIGSFTIPIEQMRKRIEDIVKNSVSLQKYNYCWKWETFGTNADNPIQAYQSYDKSDMLKGKDPEPQTEFCIYKLKRNEFSKSPYPELFNEEED